ncbi:hypothetical protein LJ655_03445 [Paraburkholderia sp. MMS20-SJTN17]|uniref:Uncharacterized protein n=1 Tax=Paraburkholderia translucens TaxID=2886945 RepID=A0ABS8K883_9BURK|nr:hypothetical protein [Paraburkholderia sp. MMS20-SJTN17]MCC8400955.1 hypothetical protein [Paraburkholderia sp. MMS20-SJTN17]
MTIRHPWQDQRVHVTQGKYKDRTGKVLRILADYGEAGFAELEFDPPQASQPKHKERDLISMQYIGHVAGAS